MKFNTFLSLVWCCLAPDAAQPSPNNAVEHAISPAHTHARRIFLEMTAIADFVLSTAGTCLVYTRSCVHATHTLQLLLLLLLALMLAVLVLVLVLVVLVRNSSLIPNSTVASKFSQPHLDNESHMEACVQTTEKHVPQPPHGPGGVRQAKTIRPPEGQWGVLNISSRSCR